LTADIAKPTAIGLHYMALLLRDAGLPLPLTVVETDAETGGVDIADADVLVAEVLAATLLGVAVVVAVPGAFFAASLQLGAT